MNTATFTTEPFVCPSCVQKIETALGRLDGVETVDVGFNSSRVKVTFDDAKVQTDELARTMTEMGYPVLKTKVK